jgi:hypothetical protein
MHLSCYVRVSCEGALRGRGPGQPDYAASWQMLARAATRASPI